MTEPSAITKGKIEDQAFSFFCTMITKTKVINTIRNDTPLQFTNDHHYRRVVANGIDNLCFRYHGTKK
jgi:hypothetical protein